MNDVWFVSDNHFWHDNILHWCRDTRRGDSVEEMNELMIEAHNSVVKPGHRVYCLGDLCFGGKAKIHSILPRLNGDIHLILGNHDGMIAKSKEFHEYFVSIQKSKSLKVGESRFSLTHTPQAEWVDCHKGVIALHGHLHGDKTNVQWQQKFKFFDVGIDNRGDNLMLPWNIEEVLEIVKDRDIMSHH